MPSGTVRVMTWNIHAGVGLDGVHDLKRIADVIAAENPDILALQEVANWKAEEALVTLLAKRSAYEAVPAVTISADDGDYGQLVLSRWPVRDVTIHDISISSYEPRRLISLVSAAPTGDLHVLATHLGLRFSERRAQAAILCEAARSGATPTVALGDFNDWLRWRSISGMLDDIFPHATQLRTFPARLPIFALDRIYSSEELIMRRVYTPASSMASDHLPVVAEFEYSRPARHKSAVSGGPIGRACP